MRLIVAAMQEWIAGEVDRSTTARGVLHYMQDNLGAFRRNGNGNLERAQEAR